MNTKERIVFIIWNQPAIKFKAIIGSYKHHRWPAAFVDFKETSLISVARILCSVDELFQLTYFAC